MEAATAAIHAEDFHVSPALPSTCSIKPTAASPDGFDETRTVNGEVPPLGTGEFLIHMASTGASVYVVVVFSPGAARKEAGIARNGSSRTAVRIRRRRDGSGESINMAED